MHTVHVIGEPLLESQFDVGGHKGRMAVVLSSEHLLLNLYRAQELGVLQIQLDTTYRLVVEGRGTLLVGVSDLSQVFHPEAYAILDHEDAAGHEHCLRQIKLGVEAAVSKYHRLQLPI